MLRSGPCVGSRTQQAHGQFGQVKTAVESISHGGEITLSVFSEFERMVGARSAGFQIAEQGIDPQELGQIPGLTGHRRRSRHADDPHRLCH